MQSHRKTDLGRGALPELLTVAEAVQRAENLLFPTEARELTATFDEQLALARYLDARIARAKLAKEDAQRADRQEIEAHLDNLAHVTEETQYLLQRGAARYNLGAAAWKELEQLLSSGKLSSYLLTADGNIEPIPPYVWRQPYQAHFPNPPHPVEIGFAANDLVEHRGQPLFQADRLETILTRAPDDQSVPPEQQPATPVVASKDVGGAPPKYDKEAFLLEAFKLLYDGLAPKTQAELRKLALTAYSISIKAEGSKPVDVPSDDWAKPIIRRLWNKLELERKR